MERTMWLAAYGVALAVASLTDAFAAPPRELQVGITSEGFQKEFDRRTGKRFAPVAFSSHYGARGRIVLAVIWEKRERGRFKMKAGISRSELEKEIKSSAADGYRLDHLTATGSGGLPQYSGIWTQDEGQRLSVRFGFPEKDMLKLNREFAAKKSAIHRIMTVEDERQVRFTAAWDEGDSERRELQLGISDSVFQREVRKRPKGGFRLRQAFGYVDGRRVRIACIWEKRLGPPQEIRAGLTEAALKKLDAQLTAKGYVPAQISGYSIGGRDRYLAVWEKPEKKR